MRGICALRLRISTGRYVAVPFIGITFPEVGEWFGKQRRAVIEQSRRRYGTPRREVEAKLVRWGKRGQEGARRGLKESKLRDGGFLVGTRRLP